MTARAHLGAAPSAASPVDLLIGHADSLLSRARATRDELRSLGFEVRYTELKGVGHCCPPMGRAADIWSWLDEHRLP